jgi:hypothetical protein
MECPRLAVSEKHLSGDTNGATTNIHRQGHVGHFSEHGSLL